MISASYITADIANSTQLFSSKEMERLADEIRQILTAGQCIFSFSRFDSFQAMQRDPLKSLDLVMQIRSAVRKFNRQKPDIRICLGLGYAAPEITDFTFVKDDLFVNTGRAFDKMVQERQWFKIIVSEKEPNPGQPGFTAIGLFMDFLFRRLTYKQAGVLSDLLHDYPQKEIARLHGKSMPTINRQVSALSWENLKTINTLYRALIQQNSHYAI
ncbi:MAG: hypothetical protein WCO44_07800 [Bacteroidota bacterium]